MTIKAALKEMRERCEAARKLDWEPNPNKKLRAQDRVVDIEVPKLLAALEVTLEALEKWRLSDETFELLKNRLDDDTYCGWQVRKYRHTRSAISKAELLLTGSPLEDCKPMKEGESA